jgi:hypothetical protein
MTADDLERIVLVGQETRTVEFKSAGAWTDPALRAQVIRSVLAMSNTRDGGLVIVGLREDLGRPGYHVPDPLTPEQRDSFHPDQLVPQVNRHAAPHVELTIMHHEIEGQGHIVAIVVREFRDIPTLCVKDIVGENGRVLASQGRLLVRSRRTSETTEVQSPEDLRELVELAVDKGLGAYFRRRRIEEEAAAPTDEDAFRQQLGQLNQ